MVQYVYDAWGNHKVSGSNTTLGNLNPFRYRSYFYDTESKLYYLKTRYYDPEVGRFINMDGIQFADPESINGLNLYAYCGNNPVNYVDYTGQFAISIAVGLFSLFTLAATAYIESKYHPIQNAVENVGNTIGNWVNDISDSFQSLNFPNNSLYAMLAFVAVDNIYLSRERNRGRDTGLRDKTNKDLEDMLNDAKRRNDSKLIQRILREMKMRGMRNTRKQRGGPHMKGFSLLLALMGEYLNKSYDN